MKSAVQKCYGAVDARVIFSTRKLLTSNPKKIRCPPPTKAWSYINTCAGVTAGTSTAHLKDCMIELHNTSRNPSETNPYPQELCQPATAKQKKISTIHNCDSAIGLHLLQNDERAKFYNDQQFSILAKARSPFHLAALEATYITIYQPVLCRY